MRTVYSTQEHGEIDVSLDSLMKDGRLSVYPDIGVKGVLSVHLRQDRLVLKANAWIGFIPINDEVAIEVRPRIAITNLEEILAVVGKFRHELSPGLRQFGSSPVAVASFLDLLANRLLDLLDEIRHTGLHFEYVRVSHRGASVIGAIRPAGTALLQQRSGNRQVAESASWQRTVDTGPNRLLRLAVVRLLEVYRDFIGRNHTRKTLSRLAQANISMRRIAVNDRRKYLEHYLVNAGAEFPMSRPFYPEAMEIARLVLDSGGLSIRDTQGKIHLPPVLLNMEDTFEKYLRMCLVQTSVKYGLNVIDGNSEHASGFGRRSLYESAETRAARGPKVTPDIVITRDAHCPPLIIDVKYKPLHGLPDRGDVEQIVTYGVRYGVSNVALAYPHRTSDQAAVSRIGKIGGLNISVLRFDLNSASLTSEQDHFSSELAAHFFPTTDSSSLPVLGAEQSSLQ